jgi:hypothetical protein
MYSFKNSTNIFFCIFVPLKYATTLRNKKQKNPKNPRGRKFWVEKKDSPAKTGRMVALYICTM